MNRAGRTRINPDKWEVFHDGLLIGNITRCPANRRRFPIRALAPDGRVFLCLSGGYPTLHEAESVIRFINSGGVRGSAGDRVELFTTVQGLCDE